MYLFSKQSLNKTFIIIDDVKEINNPIHTELHLNVNLFSYTLQSSGTQGPNPGPGVSSGPGCNTFWCFPSSNTPTSIQERLLMSCSLNQLCIHFKSMKVSISILSHPKTIHSFNLSQNTSRKHSRTLNSIAKGL